MRATGELAAEHKVIERALAALEQVVLEAERTRVLPVPFLKDLVTFSRSFVDRCHHGKEEGCLFPCLVQCGVPAEGGPIGTMLREHAEGRRLVGLIEESVARHEAGRAAVEDVLALCRDYVDLLRGHIDKESQMLFPIGDSVMSEDDDARTRRCFEDTEGALGSRAYDALTGLADRLCAAADAAGDR